MTELDYHLPQSAIATQPAEPRDHSRLMVVHRGTPADAPDHRRFHQIAEFLRPGDLLVVNVTRVVPAKLALRRRSGAAISGLFVAEDSPGHWRVLLRTRGKAREAEDLLAGRFAIRLAQRLGEGMWRVDVTPALPARDVLAEIGHVPLPPYIERQRRESGAAPERAEDATWYQTAYARADAAASVAAPTAGLHFTPALLDVLAQRGIQRASVELEVGLGTFLPVETPTLEEHPMHSERYRVSIETAAALRAARAQGRRIIAIGTTTVRTLESVAPSLLAAPDAQPFSGETSLKIAPGFHFRLTDALVTNFHLPRSTLMALVAAFLGDAGIQRLRSLYTQAVADGYRFYSYGDAMLILPHPGA